MGVSCRIILPSNVAIKRVADVIGILSGKVAIKQPLNDFYYAKVNDVKIKNTVVISMATIIIDKPLSEAATVARGDNGDSSPFVYYHFENGDGTRLMMPPSTGYWIAIGQRLIKFFGGKLDYMNYDDIDYNEVLRHKSHKINNPQDGKDYQDFQDRLLKLKPITTYEFEKAKKLAAYD